MAQAASLAAAWHNALASTHLPRQLARGGAQTLLGALAPVHAGAHDRRQGLETAAASTSALAPPPPPAASTLTRKQAQRVKEILKTRTYLEAKTARRRHVQHFKEVARTGAHDVHVPVVSWLQVVLGRSGRDALVPADSAAVGDASAPVAAGALGGGEGDFKGCATELLPGHIFSRPVNPQLLYQVVRWQRAKARKGTASSKTRAEVRGGGRKPHPQKGTGRARAGTIRAPHMRGGGVTFGPKPRSFAFKLNKQVRRAGLIAALASKAASGRLVVVDNFVLPVADERAALRRVLLQEMPAIKATHVARVSVPNRKGTGTRKPGLFRNEVYSAIGFDTSLIGTQDPAHPGGLTALHADETIADNVLARIEQSDSVEPGELLYRTGWFRKNFLRLVPKEWRDRQSPVSRANRILSHLNGYPGRRERSLRSERELDPRLSVLIVDSDQDFGEYEGNMLRRVIRNVQGVDALPAKGLNVLDILRREGLIMTRDGLRETIARLERPILRGFKRRGFDWRAAVEEARGRAEEVRRRRGDVDAWLRERGVGVPGGGAESGAASEELAAPDGASLGERTPEQNAP